MAWEKRGNGRYYYRKQRDGRRVTSQYVGHSEWLETLVALEDEIRQLDAAERQVERARRQEELSFDEDMVSAARLVQMLTTVALLSAGYYAHRRQWRRRNEPTATDR